jgi:hypothetical protein
MIIARYLLAAAASLAAMQSAPALAFSDWAFVSVNGSDSNNCLIATPCRSFQGAYNQTNPGGTIVVLTAGGYGVVKITHSVSIVNDGVGTAVIFAPDPTHTVGAAITIAAGPNDTVNLRGITIDGDGAQSNNQAVNGIAVSSVYALNIENCIFKNFMQFGLSIGPNAASAISVSNTHFSGIGNIGYAVFLNNRTGSNPVQAVFDHIEIDNSGGFLVISSGPTDVTVTDSKSVNNTGGFQVQSGSTAPVNLTLVRSTSANNTLGVGAFGAAATLRVSQSTITGNQHGWLTQSGGSVLSYGDNIIDSNLADQAAPPSASKK